MNTTHAIQPTGTKRTLMTRKGREVTTSFTDDEAFKACGQLTGVNFAQTLAHYEFFRLSSEQLIWCHILAVENAPTGANAVKELGDVSGILAMFEKARKHLQRPSFLMRTADGIDLKLFVSTSVSRFPGHIYVYEAFYGGRQFGRIDLEGRFVATNFSTESVADLLARLSADPEGVAAEYGRLTGHCCFCNTELSDERSTSVGYGPTCAKNYGLKWGVEAAKEAKSMRLGQPALELVAA